MKWVSLYDLHAHIVRHFMRSHRMFHFILKDSFFSFFFFFTSKSRGFFWKLKRLKWWMFTLKLILIFCVIDKLCSQFTVGHGLYPSVTHFSFLNNRLNGFQQNVELHFSIPFFLLPSMNRKVFEWNALTFQFVIFSI